MCTALNSVLRRIAPGAALTHRIVTVVFTLDAGRDRVLRSRLQARTPWRPCVASALSGKVLRGGKGRGVDARLELALHEVGLSDVDDERGHDDHRGHEEDRQDEDLSRLLVNEPTTKDANAAQGLPPELVDHRCAHSKRDCLVEQSPFSAMVLTLFEETRSSGWVCIG